MQRQEKKTMFFCPGNFVSVRIPRIDHASTDRHWLLCVVVERLGCTTCIGSGKVGRIYILCFPQGTIVFNVNAYY